MCIAITANYHLCEMSVSSLALPYPALQADTTVVQNALMVLFLVSERLLHIVTYPLRPMQNFPMIMQLSYTGRKQEGRETLEEVGEEVDNNMTNNMTNMTNNRQISETVCQELLNKTCPIMDRFEAWTTPANGHFVQDPPIGQENDVRITTEWGEQFALIASKKRMETVGESIVQKWMLCIRRVVPETPYLPEKCCVSKYSVLSKHACMLGPQLG